MEGFSDFPIDIGGEWIHVHPSILNTLAYDNVTSEVDIVQYLSEYEEWDSGEWLVQQFSNTDYKFIDYTWFDFFNDYMGPFVEPNLHLNCQVTSIDWSTNNDPQRSVLRCSDGRTWYADHVIVTVPIKILQENDIEFNPPLPQETRDAISAIQMLSGLKVFMKFSEKFYRDAFEFASDYEGIQIGQRYFYDATYGQSSDQNILGVFAEGEPAKPFVVMSDGDIVTAILEQLDGVFDGRATQTFEEAFVQNWDQEPFVRGVYSHLPDGLLWPIPALRNSAMEDKVFFAGEHIPVDWEWGFAHGAALSGRFAAERVLQLLEEDTDDDDDDTIETLVPKENESATTSSSQKFTTASFAQILLVCGMTAYYL